MSQERLTQRGVCGGVGGPKEHNVGTGLPARTGLMSGGRKHEGEGKQSEG